MSAQIVESNTKDVFLDLMKIYASNPVLYRLSTPTVGTVISIVTSSPSFQQSCALVARTPAAGPTPILIASAIVAGSAALYISYKLVKLFNTNPTENSVIIRVWTETILPKSYNESKLLEISKKYIKELNSLKEIIEAQLAECTPGGKPGGGYGKGLSGDNNKDSEYIVNILKKVVEIIKLLKEIISDFTKDKNLNVTFVKIFLFGLKFIDLIYYCKFKKSILGKFATCVSYSGEIVNLIVEYFKESKTPKFEDLCRIILSKYKGGLLEPVNDIWDQIKLEENKWDKQKILFKSLELIGNITVEFQGSCAISAVWDTAKVVKDLGQKYIENVEFSGTNITIENCANFAIIFFNVILLLLMKK